MAPGPREGLPEGPGAHAGPGARSTGPTAALARGDTRGRETPLTRILASV